MKQITIAVDLMGGDNAPASILGGIRVFHKKYPDIHMILCGVRDKVDQNLLKEFESFSTFIEAQTQISSSEEISQIIRKGNSSSMGMAINEVKKSRADAVVSAGNTGVLMSLAKIKLKTIEGIDRPAILGIMPKCNSHFQKDKEVNEALETVCLDLGANIECSADNLVQFAYIGVAYAKALLRIEKPSVHLLNIGSEHTKGRDNIKLAASIMESLPSLSPYYNGFIESNQFLSGETDVIISDGFSGNIALKAVEGSVQMYRSVLEDVFKKNIFTRIGYLLCYRSLKKSFNLLNPKKYNGAIFAGLNGIVVKSHGNCDEIAFFHALENAYNLVVNDVNTQLSDFLNFDSDLNELEGFEILD